MTHLKSWNMAYFFVFFKAKETTIYYYPLFYCPSTIMIVLDHLNKKRVDIWGEY
jgi:hypothetical protein